MLRDFPGGLTFAMPHLISGSAFFDSMLIDASGEKAAQLFTVSQSGTVTTIRIRINAATDPQTLRVGLYTVDGSGLPTTTAYGGSVYGTATPTANSELVVTLGTSATMVRGDRVAVVVEFDATVGSVNIGRTGNITTLFPHTALYTGSWAKNAGGPLLSLGYSDGSYPPIFGVTPSLANYNSQTFNLNTSGFDEYGFVWTAPFAGRLRGVIGPIATAAAGADFELIRYTGTTAVETVTIDGDHIVSTFNSRPNHLLFPTGMTFKRGDVIRVAVRPTTTNGITINHLTVGTAAVLEGFFGTDFKLCRRLDQGAWTDEATMAPIIYPLIDRLEDETGVTFGTPWVRDEPITPRTPDICVHPVQNQTTTAALDAADEMAYMYGELHGEGWTSGNKTIVAIEASLSRTGGVGSTFRAGFEDPSTTGHPMRGDGTLDENGTVALADITQGDVTVFTLGASKVVSYRQKVGVRFDYSDFSGGGSVFLFTWLASGALSMPHVSNYVGGAWAARQTSVPAIAFVCSDGSRLFFAPTLAILRNTYWEDFSDTSTGTGYSQGDERGNRWVPKRPWTITGLLAGLRVNAAAASGELRIFVNGSLQKTWTVDGDELQTTNTIYSYKTPQDASVKVNVGDTVIVAFRPTAGTWRLYRTQVGTVAQMAHFGEENQLEYVNRVDEGAWNLPTGGDTTVGGIVIYGHPTPMIGTYQVSGTVRVDGTAVGAGHTVRLIRQADNGVMSTLTAANGTYSFLVEPGFLYHAVAEVNVSGQRYNYRSLFDLTPSAP